jgi:RHS repeat-associated protein
VLYQGPPDLCYSDYESRPIGLKNYEITDHLGNPRVILSDWRLEQYTFNKLATPPNISHSGLGLMLDPIEMNNYYPFGMVKEGMFSKSGEGYRYGFNGMERDNETKGFGNDLDFGARLLDPRLARWKSVDPSAIKFPSMSPYNTFANNPILFIDPDGWEISMEAIMFNHTFPNGDLLEQHKYPIIGEYVSRSNFSRTADGQKYYDRYGFLPSELLICDLKKITGLNFRIGTPRINDKYYIVADSLYELEFLTIRSYIKDYREEYLKDSVWNFKPIPKSDFDNGIQYLSISEKCEYYSKFLEKNNQKLTDSTVIILSNFYIKR